MTKEKGLQQALGFVPRAVLWVVSQWWPLPWCQPPCASLLHVECEVPAPWASSQGHVAPQPLPVQCPEPPVPTGTRMCWLLPALAAVAQIPDKVPWALFLLPSHPGLCLPYL